MLTRARVAVPSFVSLVLVASCSGGGGGGGGGGSTVTPTAPTPFVQQAGIARAAAGAATLRIDFVAPVAGFEVAAFVSTNRANLFTTTPRVPAGGTTHVNVSGLTNGLVHYLGLGIRPTSGGAYAASGPIVTATPRAPIFVDSAAGPGGNGGSPAQAFATLQAGVAAAQAAGGGNVWVKGGRYALSTTLTVVAGVHVQGGFGAAFNLATRDPELTPSIVDAPTGVEGLRLADRLANSLTATLDGLRLDGNGRGLVGIDVDSTDSCTVELRSVAVSGMRDRGIRVRNAVDNEFEIVITSCSSGRNGADGLSGSGAYDYTVFNSQFGENGQEGFELDGLVPETGTKVTLDVESCQFFGNKAEGLDCALQAPLVPTSGEYSVRVRGCAFEGNSQSGCAIDSDFESAPGYSASILVRECTARANGGDGLLLDLDAPLDTTRTLTAFVHRLLASGNARDGLHVTSENRPSLCSLSTSVLVGNRGAGLRAEGTGAAAGNCTLVATHCLFAANVGGGLISRDVPASISSSIAYQQASAFGANVTRVGTVSSDDPAELAFARAPEAFAQVSARAASVLTLSAPATFTAGAVIELADDTVARAVSALSSNGRQVTLVEDPTGFGTTGLLAAFAPGTTSATEDYHLLGGSIGLGAGMNGNDAGLFGSSAAGLPGVADAQSELLFHVERTTPVLSQALGAGTSLVIDFSASLRASSANASTVRAFRNTTPINLTLSTSGARLTVSPASGNWGTGNFRLELDGLLDTTGTELSGALALPILR